MSRVGKMPIQLPAGVTAVIKNGKVNVTGPKGSLASNLLPAIDIEINGSDMNVKRRGDDQVARANHGLMRALVNNMVNGVSKGFERKLELNGVGYRVQQQGADLKFNLGFSHDVHYKVMPEVKVEIDQNLITVSGSNKQQVGQVAAEIRALRKPEPYKGKGIKYLEERLIRKSGKSGKETAT